MKVPIDRWPEVERWLLAAMDFPDAEQEPFIVSCPEELQPLLRQLIRGLRFPDSREGFLLDEGRIQGLVAATFDMDAETSGHAQFGEENIPERIGPYRLVSLLGKGGMGIVYFCERTRAEGTVQQGALKILRSDLQSDDSILRFRRERVLLAAVDSPYVPSLLDAGTTADGRPYYVMEYVDGEPITEYVRRVHPSRQVLLNLIENLCEVVQHLHEQLIVHRDIKPANVYVTTSGGHPRIKLLDFGVSTFLLSEDATASRSLLSLTHDGLGPHTPAFAAPEQKTGSAPSGAMDIYSLGKLFCLLLGDGRRKESDIFPFCSAPEGVRSGQPCSLGGVCPVAAHLDPQKRFASIQELTAAIRGFRSVTL